MDQFIILFRIVLKNYDPSNPHSTPKPQARWSLCDSVLTQSQSLVGWINDSLSSFYLFKNSTFNVFKCLNSKFRDLITKLSTHPASITFPELHNLFLSHIFINSNAFSSINISSLDVAVILVDKFVDKIVALLIFWLPQH